MNCNNTPEISIKKVVNGGYGLGILQGGKTALVRFSLPGEVVTAQITEQRRQHDHAQATAVLEPHPGRTEPPCPYYTRCGGCDLQHADYLTQCTLKREILVDLLERSGSPELAGHAPNVEPTLPAPRQFGYRQRIRLKRTTGNRLGFNEFRSHSILPINACLLAPEPINASLQGLISAPSYKVLAPIIEEVELLLNPANGNISLLFNLSRPPRPAEKTAARTLTSEIEPVNRVFLRGKKFALAGPFTDTEQDADNLLAMQSGLRPPLTLSWEAGAFSQVNYEQNTNLIALVLELAGGSDLDRILDLYCGMGNFSIPLARTCGWVHGIESQGSAVRSALRNSNRNGLLNTSFEKSGVKKACEALVAAGEVYDMVICDPPRQGLGNLTPLIGSLAHRRIVYVSCDPATLCRDLAEFYATGFGIRKIQPVDMFPQTHHIETAVLLERDI